MTTHQITQFIKHKLEFKTPSISAHFDILHIFILRYNFFEHLKNIRTKMSKSQELLIVKEA